MVPLRSGTSVQGVLLPYLLDDGTLSVEVLNTLIQRTRDGGAEIVSLLQKGSAYYAPAEACFVMLKALLRNEQRLLPCAAWLGDARVPEMYGEHDLYTGVPTVLGREGVERVLSTPMTSDEQSMFAQSVSDIAEDLKNVDSLLAQGACVRDAR
jgi:malate dehydrogenase